METTPQCVTITLCVGVHTPKQEVHSKVGNQYRKNCQDGVCMEEPWAVKPRQGAAVQHCRIYQHRYQCPGLLRIP